MKQPLPAVLITALMLLTGCGEPIRGIDEDAKAAKSDARAAVQAAQDAARRVDELSQSPADPPADAQ